MYITKWCKKLKAALAVFSGFYLSSPKLKYTINKRCKRVFGSIFRLERNNQCSTFTINIESSLNEHIYLLASKYILIPGLRCIPTVRGVCFKVYIVYLITFQSLSSTFKCNIFLTKILANAPLNAVNYLRTRYFNIGRLFQSPASQHPQFLFLDR